MDGLNWLVMGAREGFYEDGDGPSGSIKARNYFISWVTSPFSRNTVRCGGLKT